VTHIIARSAVALCLLLGASFLQAQEPLSVPSSPGQEQLGDSADAGTASYRDLPLPAWHSMVTHIPATWYGAYQRVFQPMNMSSLVGMGALTGALVATDDETYRLTQKFYESSGFNRRFVDACVYIGDGLPHFGAAVAFAIFGFATGDNRAVRTGSQIVEALVGTAIVVHTFKHISGRQRPSHATHPGGVWDVFPNQLDYSRSIPRFDAFPSGHLSTTVATLTVIMENYPEVTWFKPVSYSLMGLVAFGLVNKGMHWYSDFPLAIALGHLIGKTAAHPDGMGPVESQHGYTISVMPIFSENVGGVTVAVQF
jgi:hypothetical protein